MFPRDYFSRVSAFIMWILLCIGSVWGLIQISRLFHANSGEGITDNTAFRDAHLYLCDCSDNGNHAETKYHKPTCRYVKWWEEYQQKYGGI